MSKIEKAIIYIGLGLAFFKTSEAMAAYAPRGIFGWQSDWISYGWAYLAGFMVEGVLYVAYNKARTRGKDRNARWASWIVAGISVAFSLTMNKIDQMITDGTIATIAGSSPLAVLHNVVFAIPLIGAVLFMVMDVIDNATDDAPFRPQGQGQPNRQLQTQRQPPSAPSQHEPVARWKGVQVAPNKAAPLDDGRQAFPGLLDGSDDEVSGLLGGANGRSKFQMDVPSVTTIAQKHGY